MVVGMAARMHGFIPSRVVPTMKACLASPRHMCRPSSSNFVKGPRATSGRIKCGYTEEPYEDDEDGEETYKFELLLKVAKGCVKSVSKRVTKVAKELLPPVIPLQLVAFTVDGAVVLGLLWILKAVLELTCVVGSMAFVGILLMRGLWSILSYFYTSQNEDIDSTNEAPSY